MSTPDIETLRARCADALERIPSFATKTAAAAKQLHADMLAALEQQARELEALRADRDKTLRSAVVMSDVIENHVRAMRAALVAARLEGQDAGLAWIENTLAGPGFLPNIEAARTEGGAQAMFDRETREHEAFRAAHPGPAAPAKGAAS